MKKGNKEKKGKKRKFSAKKIILIVVIIALVAVAAYFVLHRPRTAKQGDTVLVDYVGSSNGTVFDTSIAEIAKENNIYNEKRNYMPMEVIIGGGRMIKGFEDALYGMKGGEKKTVTIPPELAYGTFDEKLIISAPRSSVNTTKEIKVGSILTSTNGRPGIVKRVNESTIVVDFNHMLADKTLVFDITLVRIK